MNAYRAWLGGVVWLLAWLALRLKLEEAILCFAALVLLPLGWRAVAACARDDRFSRALLRLSSAWQFPAAAALTASFFLSPGPAAGILAAPWLLETLLLATLGCQRLLRRSFYSAAGMSMTAALLFIAIGGTWAVISRLGMRPQDFSATIVLLTAVHFHYAGFALPFIAGLVVGERTRQLNAVAAPPIDRLLVGLIIVGVPAVGLGISLSRELEVAASLALVAGCLLLAVRQVQAALQLLPPSRITLALISSLSLVAAMSLAAAYAVTHFAGTSWPDINTMIPTHGLFNAFGFAACGLAAWTATGRSLTEQNVSPAKS